MPTAKVKLLHAVLPIDTIESFRRPLAQYFRRRASDPNEVEDLVQEVFLRLLARIPEQQVRYLPGYIFHAAGNVLIDWRRKQMVRHAGRHVVFDADSHGGVELDAAAILGSRQTLRAVDRQLDTLPERSRVIFLQCRAGGDSHRIIADRFGISISAVEKHVARGIGQLAAIAR